MVCCGYCSAHMACITARTGLSTSMKNEAHAIRAAGGRPHNAGNKASELRDGASKALGVTLKSVAVADIPARLRAGFAVVIADQYAKLPSYLKVQSNDFGHANVLFGWDEADDRVGFFDPLWTQGARGAWAPWTSIIPALWANGNHSTTTARLVSVAGDYVIYDAEVHSRKTGSVTKVDFYNDWQMTQKRGTTGTAPATFQIMGYRGDALAMQVKTAQGWADGVAKTTLVFIDKTKVTDIKTDPNWPGTVDCADEVKAATQAEYDRVTKGSTISFPPKP
jgi:hypothetical protein